MILTETKFKLGEKVYERIRPNQVLTVVRITDNIYYCKKQEKNGQKLLVYFEMDLGRPNS